MASSACVTAIVKFFGEEPKLVERGENAYKSGRIEQFMYDYSLGCLKGKVKSSLKDRCYSVEVNMHKLCCAA